VCFDLVIVVRAVQRARFAMSGACGGVDPMPNVNGRVSGSLSPLQPPKKKLKVTPSTVETASTLEQLLTAALPDKAKLHEQWIQALTAPSVCIRSLEDIQRLDTEDIKDLPVPPLVKSLFRDVLARFATKSRDQQNVLEASVKRANDFLSPLRDRHMNPPLAGSSKCFQDAGNYRLILAREEIEAGVRIVAHRIETWAKGERIVLVGILKGAFMFVSDLCRALVRPYSVYFVEASSYKETRSQGGLSISAAVSSDKFVDATTKAPHKIVLIDELLDNGKTMEEMKQYFLRCLSETHKENDILTVCLFSKEREREWPEADITGIRNLPDLWLVGYGLDDRGTKRGWTELFAIPKVKIVETIEKYEVDKLMAKLDDSATLVEPHIFGGFELSCNHKQRYRVSFLDAHGASGTTTLHRDATRVTSKSQLDKLISPLSTVKGKYEQQLQFSFIPENVHMCAEDDIFCGDNQVYATMRCRLRKQVSQSLSRFSLPALAALPTDSLTIHSE
jgi:hypoxanthine phosphoribosyltransferase